MSIRVTNLNFAQSFAPTPGPLGQWVAYSGAFPWTPIEASPIYSSIAVRLRITGGPFNGYDQTATWNRIALITTATAADNFSGYDYIEPTIPSSGTDCLMVAGEALINQGNLNFWRDPKKQRLRILGASQTIAGYGIGLPSWFINPAITDERVPYRYWGFTGDIATAVDSNSFSAAQWRDLRGSYAETSVFGGVTFRYDWTIS